MMTLVKEQAATTSLKLPVQTDGTERRRGLRIAQARPVKIFEHASNRYFPGQTMDVSATGLAHRAAGFVAGSRRKAAEHPRRALPRR
jgi:hypothetical protein